MSSEQIPHQISQQEQEPAKVEHSLFLDHFVQDVEEETYVCNHCGKKYGVNLLGTHLTNCTVLSSCDLLFEKLKNMIWVIRVKVHDNEEGPGSGTGFSVSNDGLIMTAAHVIENHEKLKVHTIDKKFRGSAKLVHYRPEADLALLKVDITGCESVEFLSNVWLTAGEELITVGVRTCLMGHAYFGCTEIKEIRRSETWKAENYGPEQSFEKYRVLGDLYNAESFKKDVEEFKKEVSEFDKSLNPYVPIIQGRLHTINGNSGSPVFNVKGEVVGMVHGKYGEDSISIHVSELVDFLDDYIKKQADPPSRYATKDIQKE